uniref:Uncharacterized protein n=1 Tax=Molossus molossus TaxID=27622 RepID=A0A7J8DUF3_MOLMO|nr:hypothetical protein HJG59_009198 [Molossus molossus]
MRANAETVIPSGLRVASAQQRGLRTPHWERASSPFSPCGFWCDCYRSPPAAETQLLQKMAEQKGRTASAALSHLLILLIVARLRGLHMRQDEWRQVLESGRPAAGRPLAPGAVCAAHLSRCE